MAVEDNDPVTPARRMNARRARAGGGGFSGGVSTTSESLRDRDEDDDLLDMDGPAMQDRVLAQRSLIPSDHDGDDGTDSPNPRQRMNQVQMAGSQSYSREYRLVLLHRMLIRRIPLDQIAKTLNVSVSTIEKDRVLLKQKLRDDSRALHIDEMVGGQMEIYNEISGMALRIASDTGTPTGIDGVPGKPGQTTAMRLAAMRTALATEADRTRFLNTAGVFDVLNYRRPDDGSDVSDVQRLMSRTEEMMARLASVEDPEPQPRKRIVRTGGFKEFTMDDKDASSGDNEVQDI